MPDSKPPSKSPFLKKWDLEMESTDKGDVLPSRRRNSLLQSRDTSTVRKTPSLAQVSGGNFPSVFYTGKRDWRDDKKDRDPYEGNRGKVDTSTPTDDQLAFRKKLVAPTAGFISAGLEISIVWPSEYAKVQMQLNRSNPSFKIIPHILERGFKIYNGLTPLLIGAPIQGFLRFGSLDYFNNLLRDPESGKTGRASGLIAGATAGVLESIIVVTPMETVKTRLIDSGKGLTEGVKYVIAKDGIKGLYKGLFATMAKSASNQALRFFIFNEYKRAVIGDRPVHELSTLESLVGGMTAGCLGALGNTPFDTIKTRMQGLDAGRYKGMVNCGSTMVKEEGVLSLWKGLVPRMGRVVPGQGIIFCSFESISNVIRSQLL